jgi:membrane-associated protease RseP (regulator of RpoE activity)
MRLLSAGSYANFITGFVVLILIMNFNPIMSVAFNQPTGAFIYETEPGTAGAEALQFGDVIIGLNDTDIDSWNEVGDFLAGVPSGTNVTIHTLEGSATITLGGHPQNETRGYIGIYGTDYWEPKPGWDLFLNPLYVFHVNQILVWSWIILISVGLFNLLPIPLFDGDKILRDGLRHITKDEKKIQYVMWPARILAISIVLLSIGLSLWMGKGLF